MLTPTTKRSETPQEPGPFAPGDALEASIYRYLKTEIKADRFYLRKDSCKVFHKRSYYSRERGGEITFDVAIEVYAPGTKDICLVVLIECKDYAGKVPVNDVEEFHSKVRQVAGSKGIMVSTAGFQRGTLQFAASNKIGLARYFAPNQLKWELRRALVPDESGECLFASRDEVLRGLTGESTSNVCSRLYGYHGSSVTNVPSILMKWICEDAIHDATSLSRLRVGSSQPPQVAFVAPEEIRVRARSALDRIRYSGGKVDLDAICAERAKAVGLVVRRGVIASDAEVSAGILGRVRFAPLDEIVIYDGGRVEIGTFRFTLAHEIGHVVLDHGRYIEAEYCDLGDIDPEASPLGDSDLARMEWQANRFASELLMPAEEFAFDFRVLAQRFDVRERGFGALYVDNQGCNRRTYLKIAGELSGPYGVSLSAVTVRLKTLELLKVGDVDGMSAGLRAMLGRLPEGARLSQMWWPTSAAVGHERRRSE